VTNAPRDIDSVVTLMKASYCRVNQGSDSSFTELQRKAAEQDLRNALSNEGITYSFHFSDGSGDSFVWFNFASLHVEDTAVIVDVRVKGDHPIQLARPDGVLIDFEPRDLSLVNTYAVHEINNAEFMQLRKGEAFAFRGKVTSARYYFGAERVELRVDSQHPNTLGKLLRRIIGY